MLILAVMMALVSPFGMFVSGATKSTTQGLFDVNSSALNTTGIEVDNLNFDNSSSSSTTEVSNTVPEGGTYYVGVTSITVGDYTGTTTTLTAGQKLPDTAKDGDVFVCGDYKYKYNSYFFCEPNLYWRTGAT